MSLFRIGVGFGEKTDIAALIRAVDALQTELRFTLSHLDSDNFTEEGLRQLAKAVSEVMEGGQTS